MTRTRSSIALLGFSLGIGLLLTSCTTATPPGSPPSDSATASSTSASATSAAASQANRSQESPSDLGTPSVVATGLQAPWSVAFSNNTPLVSERDSARILELAADGTARTIGTVAGVAGAGEGGLLGITVDGQGRLFAYSSADGGQRHPTLHHHRRPRSAGLG